MSAEDETAKMATEGFVTEYVAEYSDEHEIQPYSGTPKKDGVASAGNASTGFACGDHVHPTDTSRLAVETFNTEISNLRNSFFDNVSYDENSKKILFKNGNTVLKELPATQFIKDGMVSSVAISNEKLVISFNTDAGKEDIQIPLTDIFNPSNYYDKTAADGRFVQKEAGKGLVSVDATLTTQGAAADAKATGDALRGGFTEWEFSDVPQGFSVERVWYETQTPYGARWAVSYNDVPFITVSDQTSRDATELTFEVYGGSPFNGMTATRHLITPTKTSQLTNDGAPNGGGTPYATTAQIPDVTGKADKAVPSAAGNLAALNAQGNLEDSGAKPSDLAAKSDLPYAMVTPGEWEFSGSGYDPTKTYDVDEQYGEEYYSYLLIKNGIVIDSRYDYSTEQALSVEFTEVTATRPSLPGHLLDRANNLVDATTGNVTLILPPFVAGKVRDLLVHVNLGDDGTNPYTATVNFPSGETNTGFKVKGNASAPIPAPDAAGEWLFSFSESSPHKMAVSLAQLQDATVAGGS